MPRGGEREPSWLDTATPQQRVAWAATVRKRASRMSKTAVGRGAPPSVGERAAFNARRRVGAMRAGPRALPGTLRGADFAAELARTSMFARDADSILAEMEGSATLYRGMELMCTNGYPMSAFLTPAGEWRPRFLGSSPQALSEEDICAIVQECGGVFDVQEKEKQKCEAVNASFMRSALYRANDARFGLVLLSDDLVDMWAKQKGRCALTGARMIQKAGSPFSCALGRIDGASTFRHGNVHLTLAGVDPLPGNKRKITEDEVLRAREPVLWDAAAWKTVCAHVAAATTQ